MLSIVLTTLAVIAVVTGVALYYGRSSKGREETRDFKSDGQLHMIYPES